MPVIGGVGESGQSVSTSELYPPDSRRLSVRAGGSARLAQTATLVGPQSSSSPISLWVAGGAGGGSILGTSELHPYDPASGSVTASSGPSLVTARQLHSAVRLQDGRVALFGGLDTQVRPLGSIEL